MQPAPVSNTAAAKPSLKRATSAGPIKRPPVLAVAAAKDDVGLPRSGPTSEANRFHSSSYMSLLAEGEAAAPLKIYSDRDFQSACAQITDGLTNASDWNLRVRALLQLQGLVIGDGAAYDLHAYLRSIHDLVIQQVLDLRSSISKEACRTIAVIATHLRSSFVPYIDLLLPPLMKQVAVKIAVISSAADRCLRILIDSLSDGGSHRILQLFIDQYSSKNPILRRNSIEYVCLICALWTRDAVERSFGALKQMIKGGLSDADAGARKCARYLFAVLRGKKEWQPQMEAFLSEFDSSAQRLIVIELHEPSSELSELLRRSQPTSRQLAHNDVPDQREGGRAPKASMKRAASRIARPPESVPKIEDLLLEDPLRNGGTILSNKAAGPIRVSQHVKRSLLLEPPSDNDRISR